MNPYTLSRANLDTYYLTDSQVNLEGLHPHQCFIYGMVLSFLAQKNTPLVIKKGQCLDLFMHSDLTCLCVFKRLQWRGLIDLSFDGDNTYISNVKKQKGVA